MAKKSTAEHADKPLAWWLPSYLREHSPRLPERGQGTTPSKREDDPHPPVSWPLPPLAQNDWTPVAHASKFTLYALEVMDAALLHELLHLPMLAADRKRWFFGSDGLEFQSAARVAAQNLKQATETARAAARDAKRKRELLVENGLTPTLTVNGCTYIRRAKTEGEAELLSNERAVREGLERAEQDLEQCRIARDKWNTEANYTDEERQLTRERFAMLDAILGENGANWIDRDIAELIFASEKDWPRPPIQIRGSGDDFDVPALVSWIRNRRREMQKSPARRILRS